MLIRSIKGRAVFLKGKRGFVWFWGVFKAQVLEDFSSQDHISKEEQCLMWFTGLLKYSRMERDPTQRRDISEV